MIKCEALSLVFLLLTVFLSMLLPFCRYNYRTADALLRDFELMKTNAVKFNGPANPIALEAVAIYDFVKNQIEANRHELTQLEGEVDVIMSGKTKNKIQKSGKTKKSNSGGSRNMASAGGVSVDLGDLSRSMQLDGGSDDSDSDGSFEILGSL